jgi:hypothetical protein
MFNVHGRATTDHSQRCWGSSCPNGTPRWAAAWSPPAMTLTGRTRTAGLPRSRYVCGYLHYCSGVADTAPADFPHWDHAFWLLRVGVSFFPLIFTLTCTKCVYYKMLIPPTYDDQFPCYKKGLFACYYVQQLISFPLHAHRGLWLVSNL